MSMAEELMVSCPTDQEAPATYPHQALLNDDTCQHDCPCDDGDRHGMAKRDGRQCHQNRPPALSIEAECHSEQPAHGGIETMECP